ncbi:hypothetical protein JW977_04280 [Candidatus Falkowbacteria bacterium]|nr:hypothetical protein [Candidatus Falkowbacteria bacterium]
MPLTDKDRMSLFGALFVEYLEVGDNVEAIRIMQYDDEELAIITFWKIFNEVSQELIGLNSWISIAEAELLFKTLLPHYGITNDNIWWAIFNQDPTLHMWKQQQALDEILQTRNKMINGDKKNFDRQILIQSYISQFMIGTCELQTSTMVERREFTFFEETKRLVRLLTENKIKCSPNELKNNILKVFPGLSKQSYLLSMIDKYFANELQAIKGEDFVIDYEIELIPIDEKPKVPELLEIKELIIEPKTQQVNEALVAPTGPVPKIITLKMQPESIAAYLDSFIPKFNDKKELKERIKEELSKIRKAFVTGPDKLRIFRDLLGGLIKLYAPRYNYKKSDDILNQKIGQIYGTVNALHTAISSDTAIITGQHEAIVTVK